jgi:hypothetical protein
MKGADETLSSGLGGAKNDMQKNFMKFMQKRKMQRKHNQ